VRSRHRPAHRAQRSTFAVLAGGASWNTIGQLVPLAVNLVMTPYIIHGFGIDRWGLIALVTTIESILTTFDGGLGEATNRYFAMYAGRGDRVRTTQMLVTVLALILAFGVVVSGLGWYVSPLITHAFSMPNRLRPETVFYLRTIVALIALTFARNAVSAVIHAQQRYGLTSMWGLASYVIWIGGLVLSVANGWGLRGVAATFLAQQLFATVTIVPLALQYLTRTDLRLLGWGDVKELFSYSGKIQIAGLANLVNAEIDSLVIGTVLSVHSLALFNTGAGFAGQVRGALSNGLAPAATHMARTYGSGGDEQARATFVRLQRGWVVLCNAFFAAAIGAAYYGIIAWLGPQFRLAGEVAMVMLVGQGINLISSMLGIYCVTIGRAGMEMRLGIFAMVVNVGLTIPLVFLGTLGVVVATAIAITAAPFYLLRMARKQISPDLPSFMADISIIATLTTAAAVFAIEYLVHGYLPSGALGLLSAGLPAVLGIVLFSIVTVGPRALIRFAKDMKTPIDATRDLGLGGRISHHLTQAI
jgi:O-antigen/teichoic acid export membrane protein